jgi:two-component system, LuxR family, response regulator DctR
MVYLVDDEEVLRDALAWLLRSRRLLSEGFASAEAFIALLDARRAHAWPTAPSCLLLDVRMPGMSGLALFDLLALRGLTRALPVIVEKPFSDNALVDRVEEALASSREHLEAAQSKGKVAQRLAELTEREREVMQLVIDGKPNKLVADALGISVRTVEVHRARVFDKMNVKSAVELANLLRG